MMAIAERLTAAIRPTEFAIILALGLTGRQLSISAVGEFVINSVNKNENI
jgi:hypothetical protein